MRRHGLVAAAMLCGLAACGGSGQEPGENAPPAAEPAPAIEPAAVSADAAQDAISGPLQAADIDAYARGMAKELEQLRDARERLARAREAGDDDARTMALMAMASPDIDAAGAAAAGLDPARYGFVKNAIDTVIGKLELQKGLASGEGTQALLDQLGDPYDGLSGDVRAAMQPRSEALSRLRAEAIGIRVKAAEG